MATVDCNHDCRDEYDDFDDVSESFADPLALADSEHSDAARAAAEGGEAVPPRSGDLHRIAEVRRQQGVTLRNVARRLGIPLPNMDNDSRLVN